MAMCIRSNGIYEPDFVACRNDGIMASYSLHGSYHVLQKWACRLCETHRMEEKVRAKRVVPPLQPFLTPCMAVKVSTCHRHGRQVAIDGACEAPAILPPSVAFQKSGMVCLRDQMRWSYDGCNVVLDDAGSL